MGRMAGRADLNCQPLFPRNLFNLVAASDCLQNRCDASIRNTQGSWSLVSRIVWATLGAAYNPGEYRMSQELPAQTVLPCSQCGRQFAHSELVPIAGNWVCGDCKPAFLSRIMASGAAARSPLGWHYGGFWIRFGARVIDNLVLGVPLFVLVIALLPNLIKQNQGNPANPNLAAFMGLLLTLSLVYFLILISYEVLMLRYRGGTLGKMACGLKVVRADGSELGWGVSFGRFFMWNVVTSGIPYLSVILTLTSGIMAGTDSEKRALHDRVCNTRVIYK